MEMMPAIEPDLADRAEHETACCYCLRRQVFGAGVRVCESCRLEVRLSGGLSGLNGTSRWQVIQGIRDRYNQQTIERRKERYGR